MTRVTFVTGAYRPDRCGVADYTAHLREHLEPQGIQSTVLTTQAAAQALQDPTVHGAVADWTVGCLISLVRKILSTEADLLHIQHAAGSFEFQRSLFLLPFLLRRAGYRKPIVTTAHEYGWWEWHPQWIPAGLLEFLKQWGQQRRWWDREDGFLLTGSDAILTTNDTIAETMAARLPWLRDRIFAVPIAANIDVDPCDRAQARQALRQARGWPEEALVLVFFGFLHPVKGLETLLNAFKVVTATWPQVRLLLIGGVETLALPGQAASRYWDQLQQQIIDLGVDALVDRTGYIDEQTASRYLSGADIGVLPFNPGVTLKSGSLLALLAHQLPTVITQSEETDAVLVSANFVKLVPPRTVDELAHVLLGLLENTEERQRLSQAGYQFGQQFGWDAIAQEHQTLYERLVGVKRNVPIQTNRLSLSLLL